MCKCWRFNELNNISGPPSENLLSAFGHSWSVQCYLYRSGSKGTLAVRMV